MNTCNFISNDLKTNLKIKKYSIGEKKNKIDE